jgi:hypothetical protein
VRLQAQLSFWRPLLVAQAIGHEDNLEGKARIATSQ